MTNLLFLLFAYLFPLFMTLKEILEGSIPFWYDSARDLLQSLDNLKKFTLIGPTGGIPGVFYGPHWIWFQSLPLIFTRDPRYVMLVVLVIPYFIGFAYLLYKLSKKLGKMNTLFLWLLFMYGFHNYTTYLWQPHLAPIFIVGASYVLLSGGSLFILGVILGLLVNFHISFGVGVVLGTLLFLILERRNIFLYLAGVIVVFIPNIIFEFRHDFLQTKAVINTLTQAVLYNSAVVGQVGLKPGDILYSFFFSVPEKMTKLGMGAVILFYLAALIYYFYFHKPKKHEFLDADKIIRYVLVVSSGLLAIYLSSRNPIWSYHFVGVETLWILFLGALILKLRIPDKVIAMLFIIVSISMIWNYYKNLRVAPLSISSLYTKKYIVEQIFEDSGSLPFVALAYSPAIYTFDYDYLFRWLGGDKYGFVPAKEVVDADLVYLIIPNETEVVQQDFTNNKTPNKIYKTEKSWKIEDGTVVIKRVKI